MNDPELIDEVLRRMAAQGHGTHPPKTQKSTRPTPQGGDLCAWCDEKAVDRVELRPPSGQYVRACLDHQYLLSKVAQTAPGDGL